MDGENVTLRISISLIALAVLLAEPVSAAAPVTVQLPHGLTSSGTSIDEAPDGQEYVVIADVRVRNPSNVRPQTYRLADFQLVIGERRYTPTPRPHLSAIDLSRGGLLAPGELLAANLSFLIPARAARATIEFLPADWYDSYGTRILYCCT